MTPEAGLELQERYRLIDRIAVGGMGEVWRATDLRSGRAVAAKILRPELTGDELFLKRLRAEAANSRSLRHPNLAVVLDAGEKNGTGWIIMELVHGDPLSDLIAERGLLPCTEILPILAQTARALQVVHDSGVVHRDVKPSNIIITPEGLAKLTDFGISTSTHQLPMTATGMVMGTAQYLAPEQAMGNGATPAGDLYSLGVIAYEALTGGRPFTGATQVDIAFAHVNSEIPTLPTSIPYEVREIVTELLAKRPTDRPRSARDLARRLDRIIVNLPQEKWNEKDNPSWSPVQDEGVDTNSPTTSSLTSATHAKRGATDTPPNLDGEEIKDLHKSLASPSSRLVSVMGSIGAVVGTAIGTVVDTAVGTVTKRLSSMRGSSGPQRQQRQQRPGSHHQAARPDKTDKTPLPRAHAPQRTPQRTQGRQEHTPQRRPARQGKSPTSASPRRAAAPTKASGINGSAARALRALQQKSTTSQIPAVPATRHAGESFRDRLLGFFDTPTGRRWLLIALFILIVAGALTVIINSVGTLTPVQSAGQASASLQHPKERL